MKNRWRHYPTEEQIEARRTTDHMVKELLRIIEEGFDELGLSEAERRKRYQNVHQVVRKMNRNLKRRK